MGPFEGLYVNRELKQENAQGDARRAKMAAPLCHFMQRGAHGMPERADKPNSVPPVSLGGGDHLSGMEVALHLLRPTRRPERAALRPESLAFLFGLAPNGVCLAGPVTWTAGGLLHRRFTLTGSPHGLPAPCFLLHLPSGHPAWTLSSIVLCGVRTFLRRHKPSAITWPSHRQPQSSMAEHKCQERLTCHHK